MESLRNKLNSIDGGQILDVASGPGDFIHTLNHILHGFENITGIDKSNKAIFEGKREFKDNEKISFQRMDAYKMKFEDTTFDTVSISNSLHHFNDVDDILHEMDRVLKPDGHFLINEMCSDENQSEAQKNHVLLHHWWAKVDSCFGSVHNSTYTKHQMENIISGLELRDLEVFEYSFPVADSKDKELTGRYLASIDPYINPLKDMPEYKKLKEEAEMIKERIKEYGFAPARSVFFIGKKK